MQSVSELVKIIMDQIMVQLFKQTENLAFFC